ncbi:MAG: hypothetical protein IKT80_06880 [Bacteroidaceae bacterium]|nr:hypothetical protein [Bacteroidaceae bacterium]
MKKNKIISMQMFVLLICCLGLFSCRNAGQYVDDLKRYTDDVLDGKVKIKAPKHLSIPKDCPYCEDGYYWYEGYKLECSFCDGKGHAMKRLH